MAYRLKQPLLSLCERGRRAGSVAGPAAVRCHKTSRFDLRRIDAAAYAMSGMPTLPTAMSGASGGRRCGALWHPSLGLRFAPAPAPAAPLYPPLDVSRFAHPAAASGDDGSRAADTPLDVRACEQSSTGCHTLVPESSFATVQGACGPDEGFREDDTHRTEATSPGDLQPSFAISAGLLDAAKAAATGSAESFWSHTLYERRTAAGMTEKVRVHYCTTAKTMEAVCQKYLLGQAVLGFDIEWMVPWLMRKDDARENVSLIQLASPSHIGLFHVGVFQGDSGLVAPTFDAIMGDANMTKAGVNIMPDARRVEKFLGVKCRSLFELSHLYKVVKCSAAGTPERANKKLVPMAVQVEECLGLPMFKGEAVRAGNWTRSLSQKQIQWMTASLTTGLLDSASDAYAGLQLYQVLEAQRQSLHPCPPRPHHAELGLPLPSLGATKARAPPRARDAAPARASTVASAEHSLGSPMRDTVPICRSEPGAPDPVSMPTSAPTYMAEFTARLTPAASPLPRDSRIVDADLRIQQLRASLKRPLWARHTALLAYYIWHANDDLTPESVGRLLRDPPLKKHTVITYILNAVTGEQLPYNKSRLKTDVLSFLHPDSLSGAYRSLTQECADGDWSARE